MYKIYRRNNYLIIDDGVSIPKGYLAKDILIQEIINDSVYEIFGIIPRFGNFTNQLLHNVIIPDILKEDGSPYTPTEWVDFYTVNTGFFFEITNGGGTSGIIPENQFVDNYSSLPNPTTTLHQIWVCQNSEGIQWLPGSLGGTYYPEGVYISDGTKWIYHKDNYQATQSEVNSGIVSTKWISPFTFENANKWNTKQSTLVSGTNIKTINGVGLLGSGDLSVTSVTNLTTSQSSTNVIINSDTGTDGVIALGNGVNAGVSLNDFTTIEKSKLSGISNGATVNSVDSFLLDRNNHTGTQLASTISDFNDKLDDITLIKANNLSDLSNIVTAKTNLFLENVDNTSDINKPISTATQTSLNLKANLLSPTFTGTVSGITATMVGAPNGSGDSTGVNTGDNAINTTYTNDYRASNFIANINYLTPNGSAANLTSFPIFNQNTTGTALTITGNISESQVTNLVTDLAGKEPSFSKNTAFNKNFGAVTGTVTEGNDSRLSDARTPLSHTLDSHSNVTITTNSNGEILKWNGTVWVNNTLAEAGIQPSGTYATGTGTANGTNTGDNAVNTLYNGLVTNATHTGDVTGATTLTIANNVVSNAKLAQMGANTFKANNTGSTANATDITVAQAKTLLAISNTDVSGLGTLSTQSGTFTSIPQANITNLTTDLASKQATLVSATNIKTVNGNSLLGSGDLIISGGGSSNLDGLTDVIITTPINGQTLSYDGTNWVNNTPSGGGSGLSFQEVMRLKIILNNG